MTKYQEQYVTFDTTKGGERSLRLFIESVPEAWHADFYELDGHGPTGHFITQYFRTEHPIDRFVATPLVRDLPGAVDWGGMASTLPPTTSGFPETRQPIALRL